MDHKNYKKKRGSLETEDTAFPKRRYASIDSVASYATQRQGSVDENTLFDANNRRSKRLTRDSARDSARENAKSTGTGSSLEVSRFSTDDGFDTTSFSSRKTTKSRSLSRRFRKTNADKYDVNQHYYAGIAHSDLDIQTGRPPLLFQMNIVEWLWFQSGTAQRVMFMALGALFFLALGHLIFGIFLIVSPHLKHDPYLCHSERCSDLSRRLRETLNKSVDPCEDFYAFVCGSSDAVHNLTEEEDFHWNFGFDVQRVVYDFRYSTTLGRMLKKTRRKPDRLVLDLYQACLEKRKRNKLDLQPYYEVLKHFDLYDINITTSLQSSNVAISMGKILGHSFLTSAVVKVNFYRKDANQPLRAYVEEAITEPLRTGPTFRFGYKRYYTAVHTAFSTMRNELQVSDQELDVLPHDIICLELFFRDWYTPERVKYVIDDPDNVGQKPCELADYTGDIKANFGQSPSGPLDFDLVVRTMFSVSNPNWNPKSPKNPFGHDFNDPVNDPRTDKKFVERFSNDFERSAPVRFMRYLQWRVLFAVSTHLSDSVDTFMLPVKRHQNLGLITNCFHHLFTWLPFLAPHTFLKNSNTEIKKIVQHFDVTANQTIDMYARRSTKSIVGHMESILDKNFTDREAMIINRILQVNLRVDTVQPVEFHEANFIHFRKLYEGIEFEYEHFLGNIVKMGQRIHKWKTNPYYSDIYYNIKAHYRPPILFDRSRTSYDRVQNLYRIYLPMAVAESPFVNDGLHVSDFSGLGLEFAGNLEKTFYMSLVYEVSQDYLHHQFNTSEFQMGPPVTDDEVDTAESTIFDFHGKLKQKFKSQIAEYKFGGKLWNKIKYESAMDQILTTALQDQSRYHAISLVVNEYLKDPSTHWTERKSVLHGLEKYNVKQIFYMSLVNRRCDKIGPSKFAQIYEYGPLPQPIIENLALSNLIDFSDTFSCPIGSPMNRKEKVYFWDRDFNVNNEHTLEDPGII